MTKGKEFFAGRELLPADLVQSYDKFCETYCELSRTQPRINYKVIAKLIRDGVFVVKT